MDILEYGPKGWSNPHANPRVVLGDNCVRDETATGADFRLDSEAETSSVPIKAKTKSARKPKTVKTVAFEGDQAEPVLEVCYGRGLDGRQIEYYQPVSAPRPVDLSPTQHYSMEDSDPDMPGVCASDSDSNKDDSSEGSDDEEDEKQSPDKEEIATETPSTPNEAVCESSNPTIEPECITDSKVNRLFSGLVLSEMLQKPLLSGFVGHVFLSVSYTHLTLPTSV